MGVYDLAVKNHTTTMIENAKNKYIQAMDKVIYSIILIIH